jgi:hypothetical protein
VETVKTCKDVAPNFSENRLGCFVITNTPSHTSILTQQFLAKNKSVVIPHPPYSPDLAPCYFFLFPKMKLKLKGHQFGTTEKIQAKSECLTLIEKDFQEMLQKWRREWDRCLYGGGNYFEGDGGR